MRAFALPRPACRPAAALVLASALSWTAISGAAAAPTEASVQQTGISDAATATSGTPSQQELDRAQALVPAQGTEEARTAGGDPSTITNPSHVADPDFYRVPDSLPAGNGQLVKQSALPLATDVSGVKLAAKSSTRLMYTTTDHAGKQTAVTGSLLESKARWTGKGPRPLVTFAVGTQGVADRCAPSNQLQLGTEYEAISMVALLNAGYDVVATDYIGSGTPGTHSYLNRVDEGHAVLDAVRAAGKVDSRFWTPSTPVGIWGYSQGGGGSASAGELAGSYAPELKVKAVYAGAVPADLQATMANIDSGTYSGFMLDGVVGLGDSYGLDLSRYVNEKGAKALAGVREQCLSETISKNADVDSSTLTRSGQKVSAMAASDPTFRQIVTENGLGREGRHPTAPTMIASSWADDVIPYATNRTLAHDYCRAGTRVTFYTAATPTHTAASVAVIPRALIFLDRQFKDLPNLDDCWQVR